MAVCNIFGHLKYNTGNFLTFSQYVEDLTRESTQSVYYRVTPSKFVALDVDYSNFNDYKYTLKLSYRCDSYKDDTYAKWGCYGYFYDAFGNVLSKVHLYCGSLAKGRVYQSEFHVPVNAVRFGIEGLK